MEKICSFLGGIPKASHKSGLNFQNGVARNYEYKCSCQSHYLTSIKHNKIAHGIAFYICKNCEDRLKPVEGTPTTPTTKKVYKKKRQQRRFEYSCGCTSHALSATRHNRSQQGLVYICRKCKQKVQLVTN